VVGARPLRQNLAALVRRRSWRDAAVVAAFGLTLAVMNYSIYQAFARIPLGIAVTIEFLGPLAVAVATSRRLIDLLWVALAGAGVALLTGAGSPAGGGHGIDLVGLAFALLAGTAWAAYIILSRATGRRFPGASGLTIAMLVAAVVIVPVGVTAGRGALLRPSILAIGLAIGLLSSIIPYTLELEALRRVPARVFGIWMSLEPAVAALVGLVMLGQALAVSEWAAIVCVMVACAGAARGSARSSQAPEA
jgi:inner membrane transporter RhtA